MIKMLKIILYFLIIMVLLFFGYCVWILLKELMFRILLAAYKHIQSKRYTNDSNATEKNGSIKMTNQWVNQHVTNIVINYGIDHKKHQEVEIIEPEECSDKIEKNDMKRLKPPSRAQKFINDKNDTSEPQQHKNESAS